MTHHSRALKVAHTGFKLRKIWRELVIYVGSIEPLLPTRIRQLSVVAKPLPLITIIILLINFKKLMSMNLLCLLSRT